MSDGRQETGKALLRSIFLISVFTVVAMLTSYFLINSFNKSLGPFPGTVGPLSTNPEEKDALSFGATLAVFVAIHWWLSGLFGNEGMATRPLANSMLVGAGICAFVLLLENQAQFFGKSPMCGEEDPTVAILVDEVYQCKRALEFSRTAKALVLLLPVLGIPVRLIENRIVKNKRK